MKFKVGDMVRLTREAIAKHIDNIDRKWKDSIKGTTIKKIENDDCYLEGGFLAKASGLELAPEEPEFEYGEMIEIKNHCGAWAKRIFINSYVLDGRKLYVVVGPNCELEFRRQQPFVVSVYNEARKLKTEITRKEIAEKLGINKDFILVDEDE